MRKKSFSLCIIDPESLGNKQLIGGNSFTGSKKMFDVIFFDNNSYGAADTNLLQKICAKEITIAIMDIFNIAAERRDDTQTHTWKIDSQLIKNKSLIIYKNHFETKI
jgi:hypothetical protein